MIYRCVEECKPEPGSAMAILSKLAVANRLPLGGWRNSAWYLRRLGPRQQLIVVPVRLFRWVRLDWSGLKLGCESRVLVRPTLSWVANPVLLRPTLNWVANPVL